MVGPQRPAAESPAAPASRRKGGQVRFPGTARRVLRRKRTCPLSAAVEVGPTFDRMASIDEFAAQLGAAVEAGFTRVKLKFRPGWDVQMVNFVRKEFPTLTIHIDCEGALTLGHSEMFYRLEDFMLAMIEQPLAADDLVGHAMLQIAADADLSR